MERETRTLVQNEHSTPVDRRQVVAFDTGSASRLFDRPRTELIDCLAPRDCVLAIPVLAFAELTRIRQFANRRRILSNIRYFAPRISWTPDIRDLMAIELELFDAKTLVANQTRFVAACLENERSKRPNLRVRRNLRRNEKAFTNVDFTFEMDQSARSEISTERGRPFTGVDVAEAIDRPTFEDDFGWCIRVAVPSHVVLARGERAIRDQSFTARAIVQWTAIQMLVANSNRGGKYADLHEPLGKKARNAWVDLRIGVSSMHAQTFVTDDKMLGRRYSFVSARTFDHRPRAIRLSDWLANDVPENE